MTDRKKKEKKLTLPTSVRVTPTCKRLWDALSTHLGISNAALLEIIIREKAKTEGIREEEWP